MCAHEFTVPPTQSASTPTEVSARLRLCEKVVLAHALGGGPLHDVPLLTDQEEQLADLERERLRGERKDARRAIVEEADSLSDQEVERAAFSVMTFVQNELERLGGPDIQLAERERDHVNRLGKALYQAHEAVRVRTGSRARAKELQVESAPGGIPLSVCRGHMLRQMPAVRYAVSGWRQKYGEDDVVSLRGDGCLTIIEDSRAARKPRIYCDICNRKGPGLKAHALAKVKEAWKGNLVTNTGERNVLCKCGERFRTHKEKVQRCPRCERRRR
jgi:hypothetical protein